MDVVGPLPPRPVEEVAVSSVGNVLIIAGLVSNRLYMGQTGLRYSAPPRAVASCLERRAGGSSRHRERPLSSIGRPAYTSNHPDSSHPDSRNHPDSSRGCNRRQFA